MTLLRQLLLVAATFGCAIAILFYFHAHPSRYLLRFRVDAAAA